MIKRQNATLYPRNSPKNQYFHTACVTDNSAEQVLLPDAE
jgi:hypothetical protein